MDTIENPNEPKYRDWIAVYRAMRTHPIIGFLQPDGQTVRKGMAVCESMAWIDLCMEAKWKDVKQDNNGKLVIVERGQLQGARNWLAKRWGWSQDKVRWFLKKLQDDGMITVSAPKITQAVTSKRTQSSTQKRAHYNNIITVCNYDIYQAAVEIDAQLNAIANTQSTPNQHPQHNKETKKQDTELIGAGAQFARTRENLDALQDKLLQACNGAAASPAAAPGLLSMAEPIRWIEAGCDLELDILPTLRKRAHRHKGRPISTWNYFTEAVADAKASRIAPMPKGYASHRPQQRKSQQEIDEAWLEREYADEFGRGDRA